MKEAESSRSIYPQLDGKNGKIELTGASIKITTYKLKFMAGLRGGLDKSKIKDLKEIYIKNITNVSITRLPRYGGAINIRCPEAGLSGVIQILFGKEQIFEAQMISNMLKEKIEPLLIFGNGINFDICPICKAGRFKVTKRDGIFNTSYDIICKSCNLKLNKLQAKEFMALWESNTNIALGKWFNKIKNTRNFPVDNSPRILLKDNEKAVFTIPNVSLSESRSVRTGSYGGSRIRIAKGISVGGGLFSSQSHQELTELDNGFLTLTNLRLVFVGHLRCSDIPLNKIVSIEPYSDAITIGRHGKLRSEHFKGIDRSILRIVVDDRIWAMPYNGTIIKSLIEALLNA